MSMLKRLGDDRLVAASAIMFVSFVVGSVSNYAFQLVMGRLMAPSTYGVLNTLLSAMVIFSVPLAAAQMAVSRRMAATQARAAFGEARMQLRSALKTSSIAAVVIAFVWVVFSEPLGKLFPSADSLSLLMLGLTIAVGCLPPVVLGASQGLQKFILFAVSSGLQGPFKLVFGVAAILLGFGLAGVMSGLVLSSVLLFALTLTAVRRTLSAYAPLPPIDNHTMSGLAAMLLGNLGFTILTQADMMFMAHTLSAEETGRYAAAAILGKSVMYLPGSIVLAMFPMVSAAQATRSSTLPLLFKALAISVTLAGAAALCFAVAPELILHLLFGERYVSAAETLRWFGFAMLPFAAGLVLLQYCLARGALTPGLISTAVAVSFVIVQLTIARGIVALLQSLAAHGTVLVALLAVYVVRSHRAARL